MVNVVRAAFGGLGRAQSKMWYAFVSTGFVLAIILAAVGMDQLEWKTSVVDLWIATGTRVEKEMTWINSSKIDAESHLKAELVVTEMVNAQEERTGEDAFSPLGMKAHQRAFEIMKYAEVEFIHKRIEDGATVEYKEIYDYEDFTWNIYPYAFQGIRVSPNDCFQQVSFKMVANQC